jgi:hypothetical protein
VCKNSLKSSMKSVPSGHTRIGLNLRSKGCTRTAHQSYEDSKELVQGVRKNSFKSFVRRFPSGHTKRISSGGAVKVCRDKEQGVSM